MPSSAALPGKHARIARVGPPAPHVAALDTVPRPRRPAYRARRLMGRTTRAWASAPIEDAIEDWRDHSMRQRPCQERVRGLIDTDPPEDELARMARTDALLREVAVQSPEDDGCGPTRTSISAAVDGEASEVELDRIQRHAERCPSCQAFLTGAKRLATTLQNGAAARPRLRPGLVRAGPGADSRDRRTTAGAEGLRCRAGPYLQVP